MNTCKCGNKAPKGRRVCNTCRHKAEKERDPVRYTYGVWRRNARRRGKEFTVTLEEFRKFCVESNYMNGKGIGRTSLHIDREDETKGYTKDNIRALPNIDNVKKYIKWKSQDEFGNNEFETVTVSNLESDKGDSPF